MGRIFFGLARETGKDAGRVNVDPTGYFSCPHWVATFLEIVDKAYHGEIYSKPREYKKQRSRTRVDGGTIEFSDANSDKKNAGSVIALKRTVGPKRAIIKTWKVIPDSGDEDAKQSSASTKPIASLPRHEISFAFPSWATVRVISDALGEIIPDKKKSYVESASADKIVPYWKFEGGGTYSIPQKATAESDKTATTQAEEIKKKVKAKGGDVVA